jgi:hypothetical protein
VARVADEGFGHMVRPAVGQGASTEVRGVAHSAVMCCVYSSQRCQPMQCAACSSLDCMPHCLHYQLQDLGSAACMSGFVLLLTLELAGWPC